MSSQNGAEVRNTAALPRLPWQAPEVKDLPRLTELTLQTGPAIPGECGTGGSGSTCF